MMRMDRQPSINAKLRQLAISSCIIGLSFACGIFLQYDMTLLKQVKLESLQSQAEMLASNLTAAVSAKDSNVAKDLLSSIHVQPNTVAGWVIDSDGSTVTSYFRANYPIPMPQKTDLSRPQYVFANNSLDVYQPIMFQGKRIGGLLIRADLRDLHNKRMDSINIMVIVFLGSLLASVLLSQRFQNSIAIPIMTLARAAVQVTKTKDYSIRVPVNFEDDFGKLYRAFNEMLHEIQSSKLALIEMNNSLEERVTERTAQLSEEINRRQKTLEELDTARKQAEASNRSKSEFLANMSHEIRTPLNAIIGFAELLNADPNLPVKESRDILHTITLSGRHLTSLIGDILDISKIESGQLTIEHTNCSPIDIVSEVVSFLRVRAIEKGLQLTCRWNSSIPRSISTDPARLRQVLVNLVGNAIKFTPAGEVVVVTFIDRSADEPMLCVQVRDSGIGIPDNKLEAIFAPFTQSDTSVTRKFGGTGLGLTISRRLVRAMGGDISVKSEVGVGSTFEFRIKTGPLEGVEFVGETTAETFRHQDRSPTKCSLELPPAEILLVEDGETNQKLISLLLRRAGARVTSAFNGQEGVDLAISGKFDVILMDMQMPAMDGYSATRVLRQRGIQLPIIALTAHAMSGDREKCIEAGCTDYVTKPVSVDVLIRAIRSSLRLGDIRFSSGTTPTTISSRVINSSLPLDDPEFKEIIVEFLDKARGQLQEMRQAWSDCNTKELAVLAHWLKGAGGSAGFDEFTEPARQLECLAKDSDLARVPDTLDRIAEIIEQATRSLSQPSNN
jgi:signal transduction histidine kinase/DNA-binding NarL/FixJ family response regulator